MGKLNRVAMVTSVLVIGLAGAVRLSLPKPGDAIPYHARVLEASMKSATFLPDWQGEDVAVPAEASEQLKPNVLISRRYVNRASREQFSLLFVQTRDVRDLIAHYPPMCYPGRGLALAHSTVTQWELGGGWVVPATVYEFGSITFQQSYPLIVYNLMILPDGRLCPDMEQVRAEASLSNRYFGAAQVQVVFSAAMPKERRDAIAAEVLAAYRPLIETVGQGKRAG